MKYIAGGFSVRTEAEAIDFMKKLIIMMRRIANSPVSAKDVMAFVGIGACLEDLNEYTSQDAEHYRAVLLELLDSYQCKLEGGKR